jgi:hypothetical protein
MNVTKVKNFLISLGGKDLGDLYGAIPIKIPIWAE